MRSWPPYAPTWTARRHARGGRREALGDRSRPGRGLGAAPPGGGRGAEGTVPIGRARQGRRRERATAAVLCRGREDLPRRVRAARPVREQRVLGAAWALGAARRAVGEEGAAR